MNWKTRKKSCNQIISIIQTYLYKITNDDETSGFIIFLLHYSIVGFTWMYIVFGPINFIFWGSALFYFLLFLSNQYFRGCICIKAEKKLFNDPNWYGPWTAEENVTVPRIKIHFKRWVILNSILIIGRGTNLIHDLIFWVKKSLFYKEAY